MIIRISRWVLAPALASWVVASPPRPRLRGLWPRPRPRGLIVASASASWGYGLVTSLSVWAIPDQDHDCRLIIIKLTQYWTYLSGRAWHTDWWRWSARTCSTKTLQTSEFRPAQTKPRENFAYIWYLQSFCCIETTVLKNKRPFLS